MNFKPRPITYCMKNFKWLTKTFASLCAVAIVSTTFGADNPRDPGVNARQRAQRKRINQGARSGELTRDEAKSLRGEQKTVREEERAYKADGKLTPAERKDLHQDLNKNSKDIYQQKHDGETRPGAALHPGARTPAVNARERVQHGRIAEGVRSGEFTRDEAVKLRQEQRAIRTEKRAYKADGKVTAAERKDLHQDLNAASKDIYQEKHDADTRPPVKPLLSPKAGAK